MIIAQISSSEYKPEIAVVAIPVGASTSTATETVSNTTFLLINYASAYSNYFIDESLPGITSIEVSTPTIFTYADGMATRSSSGIGKLHVNFSTFSSAIELDFRSETNYPARFIDSYVADTVGDLALTAILANLDTEKDLAYYNGNTRAECESNGGIERNLNCWGAAYDLSGVATRYIDNGFNGGGALITRRHYICSNHYRNENKVGDTLEFVGATGTVHTRTILAQTTGHDQPSWLFGNNPVIPVGDLCVFLLSEPELPNDVAVYKVAGDWLFPASLQSTNGNFGYYNVSRESAFITTNQNRHCLFAVIGRLDEDFSAPNPLGTVDVSGVSVDVKPVGPAFFQGSYRYKDASGFQSAAISGDSGSPVFTPLANDELVLVTVMTRSQHGTLIHEDLANAMILDVDGNATPPASTGLTVTVSPDPTL